MAGPARAWSTAAIGSAIAQSTNYFEVAVNLGALGSPSTLQYAAYLLNDQMFNEWSYAAVPGSTFVDFYDPQVASYLTFNIVPEPDLADGAMKAEGTRTGRCVLRQGRGRELVEGPES